MIKMRRAYMHQQENDSSDDEEDERMRDVMEDTNGS